MIHEMDVVDEKQMLETLCQKINCSPYAQKLGITVTELEKGRSLVEMVFTPDLENTLGMAHGGAIFSLIDEAFGAATNSYGTVAVALNINVTYLRPPSPGDKLYAEAEVISMTRRTSTCRIQVTNQEGEIISVCQALAYRKGNTLPFL